MTREQAISELKKLQKSGDVEAAHCDGDGVLCKLLETLGYSDVTAEWAKIEKWYS